MLNKNDDDVSGHQQMQIQALGHKFIKTQSKENVRIRRTITENNLAGFDMYLNLSCHTYSRYSRLGRKTQKKAHHGEKNATNKCHFCVNLGKVHS